LLAASVGLLSPAASRGTQVCQPAFEFQEVRLSGVKDQQRTWTATLSVDASACATRSGPVHIGLMRQKENAMDAFFVERFTWKPKRMEISVMFWEDEAVGDYWVHLVPYCPCATHVAAAPSGREITHRPTSETTSPAIFFRPLVHPAGCSDARVRRSP
jgi:hypothetical protein